MHTYIGTNHTLKVLRLLLEDLKEEGKLLLNLDIEMSMQAAMLIMNRNLFEFGVFLFQTTT